MYQADNACVQRWFGELTGYERCHECHGLIVDFDSTTDSHHHSSSSPDSTIINSLQSTSSASDVREDLQEEEEAVNLEEEESEESLYGSTATITPDCTGSLASTLDQIPENISVIPKEGPRLQKICPEMRGLSSFYPGNIREAPGPCSACRRVEGPHPTRCPGCTADYLRRLKENPKPPPGYNGKRPPFGQAGWRVARGHRQPKPVTLHGYGCYMQRKPSSYGGKNINNFTHLGAPPTVTFRFPNCNNN